ncbi:MAG: DEAD/DEAH box helicase, partial [Planctomycetes bacterium]|nr:DEAD/DEAH box helicase [Planctomycetota bacterium]
FAAISADLRSPAPMCRLLQGDVGSGKTALAFLACLAVVAEGAQAFVLAPTSVLAAQHHAFFAGCLAGSRVRVSLLTGATRAEERAGVLAALAAGDVDILIGTHAVIEEGVHASQLGIAVIDEQHKFGVAQRAALVAKAATGQTYRPDVLLLTATPIPRTLALTAFGDLAVSRIAGRPPGRGAVTTEVARLPTLGGIDSALSSALGADGRAFVVCPRKEETQEAKAFAAAAVHRHLVACFPGQVALIHGDLSEDDKNRALESFAHGSARILVTTTVVEVGIDVAAATLLLVLDAERFGLAQLHQLRGRIGRGSAPGRCILYHRSEDAPDRLLVLAQSDDGLAIAEADLATRGPGELLGTSQHGAFALRIADLPRDIDLLQDAHESVRRAIARGETMPAGLQRFLGTTEARWLEGG